MPSGSTRVIVASLYSLPLAVLKSLASAGDANSVAKISSAVCQYFTRLILHFFAAHRQSQSGRRSNGLHNFAGARVWGVPHARLKAFSRGSFRSVHAVEHLNLRY